MKILHFGDIHFWHKQLDMADFYYPKRWLGIVNLSLRRHKKFPPELAHAVARHIAASDADAVIFSGDMSTMSLNDDFAVAAEAFAPIHEKWGDRFFVIPGNHDRYTPLSVRQKRYETHFPYQAPTEGEGLVGKRTIGENLTVVGVDCSEPFAIRSNGIVRDQTAKALDSLLTSIPENHTVILVGHFPYATPADQPESWSHGLIDHPKLSAVIKKHNPAIYLHGHKHARWAIRPAETPATLCLNCGASGMQSSSEHKHAGFVTFEINNNAITNLAGHHLSPDTDSMLSHSVPGWNPA